MTSIPSAESVDVSPERARVWLAWIVLVAAGLRFSYAYWLPGQGRDLMHSDMGAYDQSAWAMVERRPITGQPGFNGYHPLSASTYYQVGYTWFVAAIYAVFGHAPAAVRLVQAAVSTASVGLQYGLGARLFSRRAGLLAAALAAGYLPFVYYTGLLLTETWFTLLQLVSVYLWLCSWPASAVGRPKPLLALAAGVLGGMACTVRTAFLPAVAALAVGAVACPLAPVELRWRIRLALLFVAGAALAIAPATVRNFQIHHRFILISTNGPSTFYTGHVVHRLFINATDAPAGATDAVMADHHRALSWRYLQHSWVDWLLESPEFFAAVWLGDDFWPAVTVMWSYAATFDRTRPGRVRMVVDEPGSPAFGTVVWFPDLMRYVDRFLWPILALPAALAALLFLPGSGPRRTLCLALVPYLIIPMIACPFPRYRIPAVALVFILAGQSLAMLRGRPTPLVANR